MIKKTVLFKRKSFTLAGGIILVAIIVAGLVFVLHKDKQTSSKVSCKLLDTDLANKDPKAAIEAYKKNKEPCNTKEKYANVSYDEKVKQINAVYIISIEAFKANDKATANSSADLALAAYASMNDTEKGNFKDVNKILNLGTLKERYAK